MPVRTMQKRPHACPAERSSRISIGSIQKAETETSKSGKHVHSRPWRHDNGGEALLVRHRPDMCLHHVWLFMHTTIHNAHFCTSWASRTSWSPT